MPFISAGGGIYRISADIRTAAEADRGFFHGGATNAAEAAWPGYPSDPVVPDWHPWPPEYAAR